MDKTQTFQDAADDQRIETKTGLSFFNLDLLLHIR